MDDKTNPTVMSLAAFARSHQVAGPTVTGWRRRGYLVMTADGKVDVAASNKRLADRPDVHRGGRVKVRPGKPAVVVDASALGLGTMFCSAGRRGLEIEIAPADLIKAAGATVAAIAA